MDTQGDNITSIHKKVANKNILARIFAPTAAFLARMASHGSSGAKQSQGRNDALRQSMMETIHSKPQVTTGRILNKFYADLLVLTYHDV